MADKLLQKPKPSNPRAARALSTREPLSIENAKKTLFLRGTKCSQTTQNILQDLHALKRPLAQRFTRKNEIHPFTDASSLEFFAEKNDCSLLVMGSHSKKRPNCLTFVRCFDHKVLDMLEFTAAGETARTLAQFKNKSKPAVGLKPLLCFAGTPFESPVASEYTLAKSLLFDFFKGEETDSVDVEGLQYMICVSAEDEISGEQGDRKPEIKIRAYMIRTKKAAGSKVPRVEMEEMGPRVDLRVGRFKAADEGVWKEAMRRPRGQDAKTKKNVETDLLGDKVGRIHLGRQDLSSLQTRKMKGLKRDRGENGAGGGVVNGSNGIDEDGDDDIQDEPETKKAKV